MNGIRVDGLEDALDELSAKVKKVKYVSRAALWEAGLKIMRAAQQELRASVITGNLRASGYVRNKMATNRPDSAGLDNSKNELIPNTTIPDIGVELGFTAIYALYAHENMEGRAPKFLERPIRRNADAIAEIIRQRSNNDA